MGRRDCGDFLAVGHWKFHAPPITHFRSLGHISDFGSRGLIACLAGEVVCLFRLSRPWFLVIAGSVFACRVEWFDVGRHRRKDILDIFQTEASTVISPNFCWSGRADCVPCPFRAPAAARRSASRSVKT